DSETFSQQFLTPSIVEGIKRKLFPELPEENRVKKILRHRLSYSQVTQQQEVIQTRGWNSTRKGKFYLFERPTSVLVRGILLEPILHLAFSTREDAEIAFRQHVCLCRNEDILMPEQLIEIEDKEFENEEFFSGYELIFEKNENAFHVGYARNTRQPMYGWLHVVGTPVKII
ncbi:MAG TPA: hypothetical protein VIK89_00005, partial [Cytophagaceae bacterium]